jgi:single-strand DNA-binding protein
MERLTINRVEILGRVGADPRIITTGNSRSAKFPVATKEQFHDRNGGLHEETTWHNISAWQGRSMPDFSNIKKGALVHIYGRIRNSKYTGVDGEDKYFSEVTANHLEICNENVEQSYAPGGYAR